MPELPEVEVVGRGVTAALQGRRLTGLVRRCERLRWPVPADLWQQMLAGRSRGPVLEAVQRRGKYLLLGFASGTLLVHLGMSGSLRVVGPAEPPGRHDHLDLLFGPRVLRFNDPRRFGAIVWAAGQDIAQTMATHPLLARLGVEPLSAAFDAGLLFAASRDRVVPVKQFLLSGQVVIGVGNIYASESLFRAGIDPRLPAGQLRRADCARLETAIRQTLTDAIAAGGSSLKDFVDSQGKGGYFQLQHQVYGRADQPCYTCGELIRQIRQQGRSTFFCPACQPLIG